MYRFFVSGALLGLALNCLSQTAENTDATYYFSKAPMSVFQFVDPNTRLDMVDYFNAGSPTRSTSNIDEECYITALSDTSLSFVSGNGLSYQLFVIGSGKSTVIGVIETIDSPQPDSAMKLYGPDWIQLPQSRWLRPALADWLTPQADAATAREQIPYLITEMRWDDATGTVTATDHTPALFVSYDAPQALQWLRDTLTYTWDGKKFKPSAK